MLVTAPLLGTSSEAWAQEGGGYTVQEGDSLWSIARKHDVTVEQLRAWNKLKGDALKPGSKLVVKGGGARPAAEPARKADPARKAAKSEAAKGGGPEAPRIVGPVEELEVDDALCAKLQQTWKESLTRGYYRGDCGSPSECVQRHLDIHAWRTERYGYYKGFGSPKSNGYSPSYYTRTITLWGMKLTVNEHLVAPLRCVERAVAKGCATCTPREDLPNECSAKKFPYRPHALSGLRTRNTFRGGEVSNHIYGIAIDLDPSENTCCGCVGKWKAHPMCRKPLPAHERMIMPYCWVEAFERYGFYWLGRDKLQDTMHFEFLSDPAPVREAVNAALAKP